MGVVGTMCKGTKKNPFSFETKKNRMVPTEEEEEEGDNGPKIYNAAELT